LARVKTLLESTESELWSNGTLSISKWIMKQYWRVGTIRALSALAMGMLVIGRWYYGSIPILKDWGIIGALILGAILFCGFLAVGWVYDIKAKMWSQKTQVSVERNPYYYVPNFKNAAFEYPIFYSLLKTLKKIMVKMDIDTSSVDDLALFLESYFSFLPKKTDIQQANLDGDIFLETHPLNPAEQNELGKVPFSSKVKLGWEVNILRINWIQALTGLFQDVLIFGVLYVLVIFPYITPDQTLTYAVLGISLPMLFFLIIGGWVYDKKLRIWSVDTAVKVDRNPYSYVLEPRLFAFTLPFIMNLMNTLVALLDNHNIERGEIERVLNYLEQYMKFSASRNQDLVAATDLRKNLGTLFTSSKTED